MTKLKREVITTSDGSSTIHIPDWNEQYHSIHGAVQEARHVYIEMGLSHRLGTDSKSPISLLEIGFGTGLNAVLTEREATRAKRLVHYVGVDAFPVESHELDALNYVEHLEVPHDLFSKFHACAWESEQKIGTHFTLFKTQQFFQELQLATKFDLIYYDAFGARVQPELWTIDLFTKMYELLAEGGVLVTYAAKGSVRRAMIEVGFSVERLKGPPGKREMLRGTKV